MITSEEEALSFLIALLNPFVWIVVVIGIFVDAIVNEFLNTLFGGIGGND